MRVKLKETIKTEDFGIFCTGEHDVAEETGKFLVAHGAEKITPAGKGNEANKDADTTDVIAKTENTSLNNPENKEGAANQGAASTEDKGDNKDVVAESGKDNKSNKAGKGGKKSGKKG